MGGESDGSRAVLVRHPLTPGQISSSLATAGLPPFIYFSTRYLEGQFLHVGMTHLAVRAFGCIDVLLNNAARAYLN